MSKFKFSFPFQADKKNCKATRYIKFSYEPDAKEGLKIPFPYLEVKEAHCPRCKSEISIGSTKKSVCSGCGLFIILEEAKDMATDKPLGIYMFYQESADRHDEREAELKKKKDEEDKKLEQRRNLHNATKVLLAETIAQLITN